MINAGTDTETEDVLASIRRLVSQDAKSSKPEPEPTSPAPEAAEPDQTSAEYLVLTASQRISRRVAEVVAARDAASLPVAPETARSLADELARLESSIAELEAAVVPRPADESVEDTATEDEAPFIEMTGEDDVMLDFPSASRSEAGAVIEMSPVQAAEPARDAFGDNDAQQENVAIENDIPTDEVGEASADHDPAEIVEAVEDLAETETETEIAAVGEAETVDVASLSANLDSVPQEAVDIEDHGDAATGADAAEDDAKAEDSARPVILRGGAVYDDTDDDEDADEDGDAADHLPSMDEDSLRAMVAQLIREELRGVLGERITSNVRKLVRREIQRVMRDQGQE